MIESYKDIYSNGRGIVRSVADSAIVGMRDGVEVQVVCDRKWGEYTSHKQSVLLIASLDGSDVYTTGWFMGACSNVATAEDVAKLAALGVQFNDVEAEVGTGKIVQAFPSGARLVAIYTDLAGNSPIDGYTLDNFVMLDGWNEPLGIQLYCWNDGDPAPLFKAWRVEFEG